MRFYAVSLLSGAIALGSLPAAIAAPLAEIDLGEASIRDQTIAAGAVRLVVTEFDRQNYETDETTYLGYEVYVNDELKTRVREEVDFMFGAFSLENLDPDGVPEVIFQRFTGGAHCCSIYTVYSWQSDRLHRTLTYPLDASAAGSFEDLDGDGYSEFRTSDQRFLYAFGSYAASWPPSVVLSFRHGALIDTTQQFPQVMQTTADNMYTRLREATAQPPSLEANSVLAGYVAQKILMGEYPSGWDYMLAHYNPTDDWGLTEYTDSGAEAGTFPDYPAALEAFLIDLEYLTVNGTPNRHLDLSRTIVEQESLL